MGVSRAALLGFPPMHLHPPARPEIRPRFPGDPPREPAPGPKSGVRVWLVRHGEVDKAFAEHAYGSRDVPLSPRGEEQTRAAAEALAADEIQRIVTSPLQRAQSLGEAIATRSGGELRIDPRLGEVDRGEWQGLGRSEYLARWEEQAEEYWNDPAHWRGHGGESEADLCTRTWAAFEEATSGVSRLVIAAHRNVVRSILACALGLPYGQSHALSLDPIHGALLKGGESGWTLIRFGAGPEAGP